MRAADFDYHLPPELIAQHPASQRDSSRLLILHRNSGRFEHRAFRELKNFLQRGDVLVLNNSRVIPARLRGINVKTGGAFEMLLLEENTTNDWWAMLKPGKRARIGTEIKIAEKVFATAIEFNEAGHRRLKFFGTPDIVGELQRLGEIPLPPYITRAKGAQLENDNERYQTVYANTRGSIAAPTAGLHFTEKFLDEIRACGVDVQFVTLHVGLGTFAPVKAETLSGHVMHEERYEVSPATAHVVNAAKAECRRVIAVGTTSVRVLESAVEVTDGNQRSKVAAGNGRTKIFIHPPHEFKIVNALLTNFHLPCSTLLMLVSAFATPGNTSGRDLVLSAYAEAIRERYRFFSYGDAMLVV